MHDRMVALLLGVAAATSIACASARLEVVRPLAAPERRVALRLEGAPQSGISEEQRAHYQTLLTSRLTEKGITVVATQPDTRTTRGTVTKYNRGSRALRYFIGFGAGRGTLESEWDVVDQQGAVIGACRIKGNITIGIFGGNFDDVLEKSGDRLAQFLSGSTR